jgi:hypothetical protein
MVSSITVDLFTTSSQLESQILEEYPGLILPEQHEIDTSDPDSKTYCFYNLSKLFLTPLLENQKCPYELRNSQNGSPISL